MKTIRAVLDSLELPPDENLISSLEAYAEEIIKWNRSINLTGASTMEDFVRGPLFDALTVLKVIEKNGTIVDVGSGGGLPGIPIALATDGLEVTVVEPRSKRASFLRHVAHKLGLNTEILEVREERLPSHKWTQAVAQAVWPKDIWINRASRLVKPGGAVYVLSSEPVDRTTLPRGAELAQELLCVRPIDNKKRYASLIRTARS